MKNLILSLIFFAGNFSAAQTAPGRVVQGTVFPGASPNYQNYVRAPYPAVAADVNSANTATSSAALTRETGTLINGLPSWGCDSSSQGGYCEFKLHTINVPDTTGNCLASFVVSGDASLYRGAVYSGSTLVAETFVIGDRTSDAREIPLSAPCGATRTLRVYQSEAGTAPKIYIGGLSWGRNWRVGEVSPGPEFVGAVNVTGCSAAWSVSAQNSATQFGTQTGCTYSITGNGKLSAPTTNVPGFRIVNAKVGRYRVTYTGTLENQGTASPARFYLCSGSNSTCAGSGNPGPSGSSGATFAAVYAGGSTIQSPSATWDYAVTSDTTNLQLEVYGANTSTVAAIYGTSSSFGTFIVDYFPPQSSFQAMNVDLYNWRVDATIEGANPSLGTSSVSSYTGIESSAFTLTNRSGRNVIPAQIGCSSTNSPSGTTCSSGNESISVSFSIPVAQDVEACVSFGHQVQDANGAANAAVDATFQIVETATNAQTVVQEGGSKVPSSLQTNSGGGGEVVANTFPIGSLCGTFSFSTPGQKMLRLMYEQTTSGTIATNAIMADGNTSNGQRNIRWTVRPISQVVVVPILVNGVSTSNTEKNERITRAYGRCGAASALYENPGSWISSIGNVSSGVCNLTLAAGVFSAAPQCTISPVLNVAIQSVTGIQCTTATACTATFNDGGSASTQRDWNIICMGPR